MSRRLLPFAALALIGCAAALPGNAAPQAPQSGLRPDAAAERLAPHRAVYRLTLKSARNSSGVVAAEGAMQYRLGETCEAWTVETNIYLRLAYAERGDMNITWSFVGHETKDGLGYRFRLRHARNGETIDAFKGEARLTAPGSGRSFVPLKNMCSKKCEMPFIFFDSYFEPVPIKTSMVNTAAFFDGTVKIRNPEGNFFSLYICITLSARSSFFAIHLVCQYNNEYGS